jgi:hypothetical protein
MNIGETLAQLGRAVDAGEDGADSTELENALSALTGLLQAELSPEQRGRCHYYSANAISALRKLAKEGSTWWEQPWLEREMAQLRLALAAIEKTESATLQRLQVMTNLANTLSWVGRTVESFSLRSAILAVDPRFGMALANRGLGYYEFARYVQTAPANLCSCGTPGSHCAWHWTSEWSGMLSIKYARFTSTSRRWRIGSHSARRACRLHLTSGKESGSIAAGAGSTVCF